MTATVLVNGRIDGSEPVDIVIESGLITAIRPSSDTCGSVGPNWGGRVRIDLEGRHLLPGLWDEHVHFSLFALAARRVDVSAAKSAAEAAALMGAAARSRPPEVGMPLVGSGFRDGLWPDTPTAEILDRATGDLPTVLVGADLHCCWLNTAALLRFGVDSLPAASPGSSSGSSGRGGAPDHGLLREADAFRILDELQNVPTSVLDGWVAEAATAAAKRGVVGVVDFEMADNLNVWSRRICSGMQSLRIAGGIYSEQLDAAITAGHKTGAIIAGTNGLLKVGPFKILIDGSLNTRTAYCLDEYPGQAGYAHWRGLLTVSPGELTAVLRRVSVAGLVPAVHAIGDDANRIALDAFEAVGCGGRIEHAQLLRDIDLPRFAGLKVTASVQPEQAMDDREVADHFWAGRTSRAFALRALLDAGATIVLGSDAPVAPLDPWITIAAAVGRSRDGRPAWHPEQSISRAEAIAASTGGRRRLGVGEPADLCVVDLDPLLASSEQLRTMPVSATMIAGRFTHSLLG